MDNNDNNLNNNNNLNNTKNNDSGRFNVMPDEFFSFKYQQSRVRKEQQMRMEKEEIDKKKKRQEEKIKRILEREKIQKEKEEDDKKEAEIREQERKKKEEEKMIIEKRKQDEKEKREAEIKRIKEEQEKIAKQKQDEARKILELRRKAIEEKRDYNKTNKEQLRGELDRINKLKQETDYTKLSKEELTEFNKKIEKERKEALKKIKEQEKLNKIEQKKIIKEAKEEEAKKKKEATEALKNNPIQNQNNSGHKKMDFSFIKDLEQRLKPKQTFGKKFFVVLFMFIVIFILFILLKFVFKDFSGFIKNIFSNNKNNNEDINNVLPTSNVNYGYGNKDVGIVVSYGYGESQNVSIPVNNDNEYGYSGNSSVTEVQKTDNKEFFRLFFAKNSFNMGSDQDGDYLTDKEEAYYNTPIDNKDADGDSYPDGEEVSNLYDPNAFAPAKIIDSGTVKVFDGGAISFYYPKDFIVKEDSNNIISVLPSEDSAEYFEISLLDVSSGDFTNSIKQDLKGGDVNLLKLDISNEAYIDSIGKNVYIKFNENIIKIKYIDTLSVYNYSATFSMLIRSLMLK